MLITSTVSANKMKKKMGGGENKINLDEETSNTYEERHKKHLMTLHFSERQRVPSDLLLSQNTRCT